MTVKLSVILRPGVHAPRKQRRGGQQRLADIVGGSPQLLPLVAVLDHRSQAPMSFPTHFPRGLRRFRRRRTPVRGTSRRFRLLHLFVVGFHRFDLRRRHRRRLGFVLGNFFRRRRGRLEWWRRGSFGTRVFGGFAASVIVITG